MGLRFGHSFRHSVDIDGDGTDDIELRLNAGRRIINSVSVKHIKSKVGFNSRTGFFGTIVKGWLHWR